MTYNKRPIRALLVILCFFGKFSVLFAQKNDNESLYNWFDKTIGKENLSINNGTIHTNYDRTLNGQHRYFNSNQFTIGNLNYDNQNYFDVNLKYDIYNDELILKPNGESGYINVNLTKDRVKTFKIHNTQFVNLNSQLPQDFLKGYYEENLVGKSFVFYIKHYKDKTEILKEHGAYYEYYDKTEFIAFVGNKFEKINSKNEIVKLFPSYKNEINEFYTMYRNLKKEKESKFMENIMTYINNLLQRNSNK